uniref:Branched-chain amino acid ABC transporter permease n=1 Tax=Archaeoglobus fulgidus TaxID=2234 RepID=A0A7J2TJG3_ARCFL
MDQILLNIAFWFGIYAIVSISLNIEYGLAGIPNFGKALAVLFGAFTVGGIVNRFFIAIYGIQGEIIDSSAELKTILNQRIAEDPAFGIFLLLLCLSLSAIVGAVVGALAILPSARLSRDYLAITLLAISEVSFMVFNYNTSLGGGYYGISVPDVFAFYGGNRQLLFTILSLSVLALVYIIAERLSNSPFGRLLRAMREDEEVVKAFGRNLMVLRIKASAIASSIAAISGALFSLFTANFIASNFTRVEWTFYPFLILLLGGAGNNKGVLLGTLVLVTTKQLLMVYKHEIVELLMIPFETVWLEYIAFGFLMLLVLFYKPEGLIKEKPVIIKRVRDEKG